MGDLGQRLGDAVSEAEAHRNTTQQLAAENAKRDYAEARLQSDIDRLKETHAALVAEKAARITDLLDAVADLKAAAKRRAPKKKTKD